MSLHAAGKMLLKNLRSSTEEEARQAIMERRRRGAVEEPEPRSTFDRPSWEQFKLKMEDELSAHPDRDDARSALDLAIRHLEWLAKLAKKARIEFGFMPETLIPLSQSTGIRIRGQCGAEATVPVRELRAPNACFNCSAAWPDNAVKGLTK